LFKESKDLKEGIGQQIIGDPCGYTQDHILSHENRLKALNSFIKRFIKISFQDIQILYKWDI